MWPISNSNKTDAFFCAIVLFIARLCPFTDNAFSDAALNSSWLRCVMILEHFKTQIQSVNRAMEVLQCLDSRVTELREGGMSLNPYSNNLRLS